MILAKGAESDNLIKLSECTSNNEKMPDGSVVTEGEMLVTPLIKVTPNTIYKTNISRHLSDSSVTYNQKIFTYNDLQVFMLSLIHILKMMMLSDTKQLLRQHLMRAEIHIMSTLKNRRLRRLQADRVKEDRSEKGKNKFGIRV